jgi:hypothetical protein
VELRLHASAFFTHRSGETPQTSADFCVERTGSTRHILPTFIFVSAKIEKIHSEKNVFV